MKQSIIFVPQVEKGLHMFGCVNIGSFGFNFLKLIKSKYIYKIEKQHNVVISLLHRK